LLKLRKSEVPLQNNLAKRKKANKESRRQDYESTRKPTLTILRNMFEAEQMKQVPKSKFRYLWLQRNVAEGNRAID
jgi:hypothetical protein